MAYDISAHPLLSTEAAALSDEALTEWSIAAEYALGFRGVAFAELEDLEAATTAIVLTVNASVAVTSTDPAGRVIEAEAKGDQSFQYGEGGGLLVGSLPARAIAIARALLGRPPRLATVHHNFAW